MYKYKLSFCKIFIIFSVCFIAIPYIQNIILAINSVSNNSTNAVWLVFSFFTPFTVIGVLALLTFVGGIILEKENNDRTGKITLRVLLIVFFVEILLSLTSGINGFASSIVLLASNVIANGVVDLIFSLLIIAASVVSLVLVLRKGIKPLIEFIFNKEASGSNN
ncbi:MAG: hypothetical protein WCR97_05770 [Bacilli bacterium]